MIAEHPPSFSSFAALRSRCCGYSFFCQKDAFHTSSLHVVVSIVPSGKIFASIVIIATHTRSSIDQGVKYLLFRPAEQEMCELLAAEQTPGRKYN